MRQTGNAVEEELGEVPNVTREAITIDGLNGRQRGRDRRRGEE